MVFDSDKKVCFKRLDTCYSLSKTYGGIGRNQDFQFSSQTISSKTSEFVNHKMTFFFQLETIISYLNDVVKMMILRFYVKLVALRYPYYST